MISVTYFIVDSVDAALARRWGMLLAHHVPALILFIPVDMNFPQLMAGKFGSKLLLIEATTPLLTRWRRTKRKGHFLQFMLAFFLVRCVYLSALAKQFHDEYGSRVAIMVDVLLCVNVYWFCKQSNLLFNYRADAAGKKPE